MSFSEWFLGTSAWTYEDWKDVFYPKNLTHSQWLTFYSRYFNAVEVDSTFYHVPAENVVLNWRQKTPENFLFCAKVPRRITHELRLKHAEAEIDFFLHALAPLGNKLGMILFQFPSSFTGTSSRVFFEFIKNLPKAFSYAVEFRHFSWNAPRFDGWLREHAITRVWNDVEKPGGAGAFLHREQTASDVYVRLLGDIANKYDVSGKVKHTYNHLQWSRDTDLEAWVARLKSIEKARRLFIFSANHYEGFAPATVKRLAEKLGYSLPPFPPISKLPDNEDVPVQKEFW
ncbi:MAG: DUF72 domain-containing protein [Verrucomicrobiia bacterium]